MSAKKPPDDQSRKKVGIVEPNSSASSDTLYFSATSSSSETLRTETEPQPKPQDTRFRAMSPLRPLRPLRMDGDVDDWPMDDTPTARAHLNRLIRPYVPPPPKPIPENSSVSNELLQRPTRLRGSITPRSTAEILPQIPEYDNHTQVDGTEEFPAEIVMHRPLPRSKKMTGDYVDSSEDQDVKEYRKLRGQNSSKSTGQKSMASMLHTNLQRGNVFVYIVIPPDGGYGWLVLLISFLCQVIVDGIMFSLGIILPFIAADLGTSSTQIALVASTQIGPITTAFINKYGFRPVAIMGATLSMITLTIATFSTDLGMMILFYSVIGGPCMSMIWVSSQLIIGYYFEKYRPIAAGISCSGAGAGVLIFSYMDGILVNEFGWRNTIRIHVCFLVLVFLMVMFYVEVTPTRIGRMVETTTYSESDSENESTFHAFRYSRVTIHNVERVSMDTTNAKGMESHLVEMETITYHEPGRCNRCCQCCCPPFRRFMERRKERRASIYDTKRLVIQVDPMEKPDLYYTGPVDYSREEDDHVRTHDIVNERELDIEVAPAGRGKVLAINHTLTMMKHSRTSLVIPESKKKSSNAVLAFISPSHWLSPKVKKAFGILFDLKLLRIMEFQVLLASAFFFPMGFNIPFVYSKVRSELETSITEFISPAIGLSNFTFRIISGFIAFKFKEYTTYICGFGITFGGLITFISAFCGYNVIWFQFMFAVCFALAPAFYSTLRAIIYVRSLGLDKLTNAFGLTAMAMGLGVFIGTFMGGFLYQQTGNFQATFIFSGSCMMLAGILKLILPSLLLLKKRKAEKNSKVKFAK